LGPDPKAPGAVQHPPAPGALVHQAVCTARIGKLAERRQRWLNHAWIGHRFSDATMRVNVPIVEATGITLVLRRVPEKVDAVTQGGVG